MEELGAAGEPDPLARDQAAISVAYGNAGNCSVQSAGIFCYAIINGDMFSTDSRGDYNLEQAEKAAFVEEIEQQAEAAAEDTKIEQVETAAAPASQADGNSSSPTGGRGGWGRERPPQRGRSRRGIVRHD